MFLDYWHQRTDERHGNPPPQWGTGIRGLMRGMATLPHSGVLASED